MKRINSLPIKQFLLVVLIGLLGAKKIQAQWVKVDEIDLGTTVYDLKSIALTDNIVYVCRKNLGFFLDTEQYQKNKNILHIGMVHVSEFGNNAKSESQSHIIFPSININGDLDYYDIQISASGIPILLCGYRNGEKYMFSWSVINSKNHTVHLVNTIYIANTRKEGVVDFSACLFEKGVDFVTKSSIDPVVCYRNHNSKIHVKLVKKGTISPLKDFPRNLETFASPTKIFSTTEPDPAIHLLYWNFSKGGGGGGLSTISYRPLPSRNYVERADLPSSIKSCEIFNTIQNPVLISQDEKLQIHYFIGGVWSDILKDTDNIEISDPTWQWINDAPRGHMIQKNPKGQLVATTFNSSVDIRRVLGLEWSKIDQEFEFGSNWSKYFAVSSNSSGAYLILQDKEREQSLSIYEYIEDLDAYKMEAAKRHIANLETKEDSYEKFKELGQTFESLGEFSEAITRYQKCLSFLDRGTDKEEYSYINAHLITCQFLQLSMTNPEPAKDENPISLNSSTSKSSDSEPISTSVNNPKEQANKPRKWLKEVAQKIQKDPKIKNSIEGMKKVNMALALINQWQNEVIPRKGFEFIDEQLGVLTNLVSLVQGNGLDIEMEGGKLSFGDPRFSGLLDNVEAIKQLEKLEGKEFTEEELESVALEEVEIEDGLTFSSGTNIELLSGYYKYVSSSNDPNIDKKQGEWAISENASIKTYIKYSLSKFTFKNRNVIIEFERKTRTPSYTQNSSLGGLCECQTYFAEGSSQTTTRITGNYNESFTSFEYHSHSGRSIIKHGGSQTKCRRTSNNPRVKFPCEDTILEGTDIDKPYAYDQNDTIEVEVLNNNKLRLTGKHGWSIIQKVKDL